MKCRIRRKSVYNKSKKIIESFLNKYEFDEKEIDKLCSLANSSNSEIRRNVAVILGGIYNERAEKTLYHLSFDKDDIVKLEAVDSLAIGNSQLSLQRLKQICYSDDPYLRFYAIQSYCDVFLNIHKCEPDYKDELLETLKEYDTLEMDSSVMAAIYKCNAICGEKQSVFTLMQMHTKAIEERNFRLISQIFNLISELTDYLEDEDVLKEIGEYLSDEKLQFR